MLALEHGHPQVPGTVLPLIFGLITEYAAAFAHTLEVHDWLRKHRKCSGCYTVRAAVEPLALGDGKLVVDPAILGKPRPGVGILGRDAHVGRAGDVLE